MRAGRQRPSPAEVLQWPGAAMALLLPPAPATLHPRRHLRSWQEQDAARPVPVLLPAGREQAGSGHAPCWGGLQLHSRAAGCWGSSTQSRGAPARLAGCGGGGGEEKPPQLKVNVATKRSQDGNASAAAPMQTAPALWQPSPNKGVSGSVLTLPGLSPRCCRPPHLGTVTPGRACALVQPHRCPCPCFHTCAKQHAHAGAPRTGMCPSIAAGNGVNPDLG